MPSFPLGRLTKDSLSLSFSDGKVDDKSNGKTD